MSGLAPGANLGRSLAERFADLPLRIGQVIVTRAATGEFTLHHRDDLERDDLMPHNDAEEAAEISRYDDAGEYRRLKTAPNLRHGWKLSLRTAAEVHRALDLFYPARLAAYAKWLGHGLEPTPFRSTLERQSGMYRVAARITDEQANALIANFCRSDGGCLRTILWKRDLNGTTPSTLLPPEKFEPSHDQTGRGEAVVPLLCQEICNLLVAAAREQVKPA